MKIKKIQNSIIPKQIIEHPFSMANDYFRVRDNIPKLAKKMGLINTGGGCGFGGFDISFDFKKSPMLKGKDFIQSLSLSFSENVKGCKVNIYFYTASYNQEKSTIFFKQENYFLKDTQENSLQKMLLDINSEVEKYNLKINK